ncbi:HAD family hydrolase [Marinomonas mediterranea]|jgi:HAD-superfamily subfamily IB hydrolase, TIGR01490|uniref:HAD-superfamily subfamily IB hydrolase, TIGR01490 n=1 Tax=Marinomonas mediterranea (strain ATCC 700492 / JCM 21426 / NBRC 103028 / MMB-1) TaxID=717774 RepID=F2K067_MARM1|nr:HAD-IB family hydrolase [Marinomonas mediterranea]ADZ93281.1 HAD-superfamily subfamily IB hydrolase, TIGR01490 [Marinomonas mediterranea MMB-1]WCN11170.1 HAD-IB family hydrolase [Marinomonas mediterranea]WCN15232.1 HAD-IB family hydrolase [Marinomonas mediterranea]WCN19278.1 HAD-IB family hydrolase [Marinomonas mediterranea MMB-1]
MSKNYVVFSDVDETIIKFKSMLKFMDYFLFESEYSSKPAAEKKREEYIEIKRLVKTHEHTREVLNRRFYAMFSGIRQAELQDAAKIWLEDIFERGDLFIEKTLSEQKQHKDQGAEIVLVSGSFKDILGPIMKYMHADYLLCSDLQVKDGVYTGTLLQQVIGEGKWQVISKHIEGKGINLEDCFAYGDHESDLCFMEKVGNPVVVGKSESMQKLAHERNWKLIPA